MIHHASVLSSVIPRLFPTDAWAWVRAGTLEQPRSRKPRPQGAHYTLTEAMPAKETHLKKGTWRPRQGGVLDGSPRATGRNSQVSEPRMRLHWKVAGRISGQPPPPPGPSEGSLLLHPCPERWGRGRFQGPSGPLSEALSSDWSTLCPGCTPHNLLVTGLLSKMGPRLVQACAHVLCISRSDKASVCWSLVGWGPGPPQSPVYQALDGQRRGWWGCWVQEVSSAAGPLRAER